MLFLACLKIYAQEKETDNFPPPKNLAAIAAGFSLF